MPRGKFLIPPNHEDLGQYSSQLQANRAAFGLLPDLVIKGVHGFFIITVNATLSASLSIIRLARSSGCLTGKFHGLKSFSFCSSLPLAAIVGSLPLFVFLLGNTRGLSNPGLPISTLSIRWNVMWVSILSSGIICFDTLEQLEEDEVGRSCLVLFHLFSTLCATAKIPCCLLLIHF